eukprot:4085631-Amphidinium_carterae.1
MCCLMWFRESKRAVWDDSPSREPKPTLRTCPKSKPGMSRLGAVLHFSSTMAVPLMPSPTSGMINNLGIGVQLEAIICSSQTVKEGLLSLVCICSVHSTVSLEHFFTIALG